MSLALLWPAALLGSVLLVLPWWLHRLPRRQGSPRRFAALRFIGQHATPRRDRRVSEWPLLLLRLLLLATLLLFLAGGLWRDWPGRGLQWQAVWPGVSASALASAAASDRSVWLLPGLPSSDRPPPAGDASEAASLLGELASALPPEDRLRVLVPATLHGLGASRLSLARPVEWQVVDAAPDAESAKPRKLALRSEPDLEASPWLEAALAAWQADPTLATTIDRGPPGQPIPADVDALLWVGERPEPRWQGAAQPWLQVSATAASGPGLRDPLSGLSYLPLADRGARLAAPVDPGGLPEVLDAGFPSRLHHLLFQREPAPSTGDAASLAPSVTPALLAPRALPLAPWLALLAGLLFLAERWLASGRRLAPKP